MLYSYAHDGYLLARITPSPDPDVENDDGGIPREAADPAAKDEVKVDNSCQVMDEFGQGPNRAVAEAVARLLKIQSGIHNTVESSSKRLFARVGCFFKSYALSLVLSWCPKP